MKYYCIANRYPSMRFLVLFWIVTSFLLISSSNHFVFAAQSKSIENISVQFDNTPLSDCIPTILKLGRSQAKISIKQGITKKINKSVVEKRWDLVLQEILQENNLKLTKQDDAYLIVEDDRQSNVPPKISITREINVHTNPSLSTLNKCSQNNLITLGYQFSTGTNPYSLVGKCVKLTNFTPFQFFSATQALARWSYRGGSGVVFIEDLSKNHLINNSRILLTESIGVYEYENVLGAKQIIPHLVVK